MHSCVDGLYVGLDQVKPLLGLVDGRELEGIVYATLLFGSIEDDGVPVAEALGWVGPVGDYRYRALTSHYLQYFSRINILLYLRVIILVCVREEAISVEV